ncbi:hypothetical protein B0T16DRAFT_331101 [Cercophora newfieldiana]|uniref:Uncharacterized protein n=1 Tax=Cercophora newfieldiana TaxID=92897 RepID=A0AA39Y4G8_9PEZI|nr:hypothetical protein B0T16DRAFT_331101 [Cercophora newfieldiana]
MCHKCMCDRCHHESWVGCGKHIPSIMDPIPHGEWCTCGPRVKENGKEYPPMVSLTSIGTNQHSEVSSGTGS